jgi:hypothetical protein
MREFLIGHCTQMFHIRLPSCGRFAGGLSADYEVGRAAERHEKVARRGASGSRSIQAFRVEDAKEFLAHLPMRAF